MPQFQFANIPAQFQQGQQFTATNQQRAENLAQSQFKGGQVQELDALRKNIRSALTLNAVPDNQKATFLNESIATGEAEGRDMTQSKKALELVTTGRLDELKQGTEQLIRVSERMGDIQPLKDTRPVISAEQQTFESLIADFSDEDKIKARRIKARIDPGAMGSAIQTIAATGEAPTIAKVEEVIAEGKETGKLLAQHKLKPKVEAAVVSAVGKAKAEVKKIGEARSNDKALNVYTTAMDGLTKALDNTITGPFIGLTPALTSNAQIADGAVSMMLPLMKDVFRGAGEGTFTDADQKILTDLMPTRNDTKEARSAKIIMIDSMIRAKLATAPIQGEQQAEQQDTLTEAEQAELQQLRAELGQ